MSQDMVIATRRLKLQLPTKEIDVFVRIFMPEAENGAVRCAYDIDWPNGKKSGATVGVDSIQAIFLALKMIGIDVYTSDYHRQGQLAWFEANQGYGFPVTKNLRDLLVGADLDL
jgi:hypothetical protein